VIIDYQLPLIFVSPLLSIIRCLTNVSRVRPLYWDHDNVIMCIKFELLDIISNLKKEQNKEFALPLKKLSERLKSNGLKNI